MRDRAIQTAGTPLVSLEIRSVEVPCVLTKPVCPHTVRSARRSIVSSSEAPKTWLSQDAYDRLQAELDELIAARPAIAAEINARREEGDLRENGGYHAAREEQGKQEGRIRYLQEFLRQSHVGEAPTGDSVVAGSVVTK